MLGEEVGHDGVGLAGLREGDIVPEGVGQTFKDDEAGVHCVAEEGALEDGGATEEHVSCAGDEESWRQVVEVGEVG